jgi:hypothetical protein
MLVKDRAAERAGPYENRRSGRLDRGRREAAPGISDPPPPLKGRKAGGGGPKRSSSPLIRARSSGPSESCAPDLGGGGGPKRSSPPPSA